MRAHFLCAEENSAENGGEYKRYSEHNNKFGAHFNPLGFFLKEA
jgi:hypothetical protein